MTDNTHDTVSIEDECSINIQADPSCLQQFFNCTVHIHQHCGGCGNCDSSDSPCTCQPTDEPIECEHECDCECDGGEGGETPAPPEAPEPGMTPVDEAVAMARSGIYSVAESSDNHLIVAGQMEPDGDTSKTPGMWLARFSTDFSQMKSVLFQGGLYNKTYVVRNAGDNRLFTASYNSLLDGSSAIALLDDQLNLVVARQLPVFRIRTACVSNGTFYLMGDHLDDTQQGDQRVRPMILSLNSELEVIHTCRLDGINTDSNGTDLQVLPDGSLLLGCRGEGHNGALTMLTPDLTVIRAVGFRSSGVRDILLLDESDILVGGIGHWSRFNAALEEQFTVRHTRLNGHGSLQDGRLQLSINGTAADKQPLLLETDLELNLQRVQQLEHSDSDPLLIWQRDSLALSSGQRVVGGYGGSSAQLLVDDKTVLPVAQRQLVEVTDHGVELSRHHYPVSPLTVTASPVTLTATDYTPTLAYL